MEKVLFIGMVWPEPTSTAAGGRMLSLVNTFVEADYEVVFSSAASKSERSAVLEEFGCTTVEISLNSDTFNTYIKELNPSVVIFDRFVTEEQYGWRVADNCPTAVRVLDSEDLHFLRNAREKAFKSFGSLATLDLYTDMAKRELASIYRCDITLVISSYEMEILKEEFKVPEELLYYLPFVVSEITNENKEGLPSFSDRSGFMTIGNFRHAPNYDSVKYLKAEIWPEIKKLMPEAQMHVYGAYMSEAVLQWNYPKNDFHLHGAIPSSADAFKSARVCLAPLRFGAGLKGKLLEAMKYGTPSITSEIGAEGMGNAYNWGGFISEDPKSLALLAVLLHKSEVEWEKAQQKGFSLLNKKFTSVSFKKKFVELIEDRLAHLEIFRKNNFLGEMLQFHTLRSTEFMSRWIKEKNKID